MNPGFPYVPGFTKQVLVIRWSIYMLVLLGFVVLLLQNYGRASVEFLYFQF